MNLVQKKDLVYSKSSEFDKTSWQSKYTLNPLITLIVNTHLQSIDVHMKQLSSKKFKKNCAEDFLIFKEIVGKNPDLINVPDSQGRTPLMHAAIFALTPFVKLLLELKANTLLKDIHGFTAFKHAKGKSLKNLFKNVYFPPEFIELVFGYNSQKEDRQTCMEMLEL